MFTFSKPIGCDDSFIILPIIAITNWLRHSYGIIVEQNYIIKMVTIPSSKFVLALGLAWASRLRLESRHEMAEGSDVSGRAHDAIQEMKKFACRNSTFGFMKLPLKLNLMVLKQR